MPSKKKTDNLSARAFVGEFLVDQLEASEAELLIRLAQLNYPLADSRELRRELEKSEKPLSSARKLVEQLFEPADFPLASAYNALEKAAWKLRPKPFPGLPSPDGSPWFDTPEFGDDACGEAAGELYEAIRNSGANHWQAYLTARHAAVFCRRHLPPAPDPTTSNLCERRAHGRCARCLVFRSNQPRAEVFCNLGYEFALADCARISPSDG